jgi:uncharacterized protein (DUF2062 family)
MRHYWHERLIGMTCGVIVAAVILHLAVWGFQFGQSLAHACH